MLSPETPADKPIASAPVNVPRFDLEFQDNLKGKKGRKIPEKRDFLLRLPRATTAILP